MTLVAAVLAALAVVVQPSSGTAARRLAGVGVRPVGARRGPQRPVGWGGQQRPPGERRTARTGVRARRVVAVTAGLAVALLVGGVAGVLVGAGTAVGVGRHLARPAGGDADEQAAFGRGLPLALDLIACALSAGAPLEPALDLVAARTGGPLGRELAAVAASLRLGSSPSEAAARLRACGPGFPAVVRALARADESGSRLTTALAAIAGAERAAAHGRAISAARRVGVTAVAPLGLCFLPAFVLIGVVPIVVGAARHVLA